MNYIVTEPVINILFHQYTTEKTSYIVQNLQSDVRYELSVTAYNDAGASLPSEVFSVRTLAEDRFHGVNVTPPADVSGRYHIFLKLCL